MWMTALKKAYSVSFARSHSLWRKEFVPPIRKIKSCSARFYQIHPGTDRMKGSLGNIVMKSSIGNFRPWRKHLKNPTTRRRRVGITFQTNKCNILVYYHKLLTKQLNFFAVKEKQKQLSSLKISRLIIYNAGWGEPMNNRHAFIFALLTKLTVSPQFLLLGHLHDTENIFFFFQTRLCNKAENYSLFKVNSYEFMSSNVLIHFIFF